MEVACAVFGICLIIWAIDKMINGKNDPPPPGDGWR